MVVTVGLRLMYANPFQLPRLTTVSDKKIRKELPVEIWKKNISWTFLVDTSEAFKKVMIDPDFEYPDVDGKNNYWYGTE